MKYKKLLKGVTRNLMFIHTRARSRARSVKRRGAERVAKERREDDGFAY